MDSPDPIATQEASIVSPCVMLHQIIEGMQWQSDTTTAYLNTKTGQVMPVSDDELDAADLEEDSRELSDWEAEAVSIARAVLEGQDYIALPDRFEIDEYRMMERFASGLGEAGRARLLLAIRGSGAFRHFKNSVHELGLAQEWYSYRDGAYEQIAVDWCKDNKIEYSRSNPTSRSDA